MFVKIILLTWTLFLFRGKNLSVVIDSLTQKGIVVSDYCPKMPFCEEGAHVMCMYYDPTRVMGPRCTNARNVSMTSEFAVKLLEVSNAIRGKLAMGLEKGKGGVELPRAYGMFKLHWDNELATFAQVLANQCVLRHDICRATKRFSDPGQIAGLVRFSSPDWIPVSKSKGGHFTQPGLMPSKITYAITQALKTWYAQKSYVTPAMTIDFPDWSLTPTKPHGRPYLEMVNGPATHMGCGISAYAEYSYYEAKSPLNYNSMQVICNFSSRPKKHKSVFDLEPGPHTSRCGCPPNAVEEENCLCVYIEEKNEPKPEMDCDGVNCEQPVILLPIFTVEDAPPSKLIGRLGINHEEDIHQHKHRPNLLGDSSLEFTDDDFPANHSKNEHQIFKVLNNNVDDNSVHQTPHEPIRSILEKVPNNYKKSHVSNSGHLQQRKTSIFSRSVLLKGNNNPLKLSLKDFKKDVAPRKDFSKAKHLLNNYMESIKNLSNLQYRPHVTESKDRKSKRFSSDIKNKNSAEEIVLIEHGDNEEGLTLQPKHTEIVHNNIGHNEIGLNEIRHSEIGHNELLHDEIGHHEIGHNEIGHNELLHDEIRRHEMGHNEIGNNEIGHEGDRDTKLMTLLDKLEEEVQHIELTGNKKELFDAKIRKIYDSVVGKSTGLITPKSKRISEVDDVGHGVIKKTIVLDHAHDQDHQEHENLHDLEPEHVHEHNYEIDHNHEHDNLYKKELDDRKDDKLDKTEIAKTIDDVVQSNHNDNVDHRNNLDEYSDKVKKGRMRIKARINAGFNSERDGDADYDFKENSKKTSHKDKLLNMYRSSESEYKSHRFPEFRKSYKSKMLGHAREDFKMNRFNVDDPRNNKRLKYRDYYKNREGSSFENINKNHYRRHQTRSDDWTIDDDVLSPERRKYYQERLENLERQLQNTRTRKFRNEEDRHRRPMRIPGFDEEAQRRPSKARMDHFDMRERSRFLHGF